MNMKREERVMRLAKPRASLICGCCHKQIPPSTLHFVVKHMSREESVHMECHTTDSGTQALIVCAAQLGFEYPCSVTWQKIIREHTIQVGWMRGTDAIACLREIGEKIKRFAPTSA